MNVYERLYRAFKKENIDTVSLLYIIEGKFFNNLEYVENINCFFDRSKNIKMSDIVLEIYTSYDASSYFICNDVNNENVTSYDLCVGSNIDALTFKPLKRNRAEDTDLRIYLRRCEDEKDSKILLSCNFTNIEDTELDLKKYDDEFDEFLYELLDEIRRHM